MQLPVLLDRSRSESLTAQLTEQLREAIRRKRIAGGTRLPSSRQLSEQLAISRNTVVRAYDALMAHWRGLLPQTVMLEVQYEDVVADLEGQARRIVGHCGLNWDSRCLDFHKTVRPIRTSSAAQVRQPIYGGSVGRWRDYQAFLEPLLDELGPLLENQAGDSPEPRSWPAER